MGTSGAGLTPGAVHAGAATLTEAPMPLSVSGQPRLVRVMPFMKVLLFMNFYLRFGGVPLKLRIWGIFTRMKRIFLPLLGVFVFLQAIAQTPQRNYLDDPHLSPHDHSLDFTHLRLEIWPQPAEGKIVGKVTHTFRPLRPEIDSFFLDGILMDVKSVTLNGRPVNYHTDSAGIFIVPSAPLSWDT